MKNYQIVYDKTVYSLQTDMCQIDLKINIRGRFTLVASVGEKYALKTLVSTNIFYTPIDD